MIRPLILAGCLLVTLGGCLDKYCKDATQDNLLTKVHQFSEIPVPAGMKLKNSKNESPCLTTGHFKWGELHYRGNVDLFEALSFIRDQLTQFEWKLEKDESLNSREHFLKGTKGCYVAQFSLEQKGKSLVMDVNLDTLLSPEKD